MKFSVITLGCKVNSYESEALINDLTQKKWEFVSEWKTAQVVIVNTCTVTSTSDQKSRQLIRSVKRQNPEAIVVAMGCFTQLNPEVAQDIADIVIGTNNRLKVYELVNSYLSTKEEIDSIIHPFNIVDDVLACNDYEEMKVNSLKTHTRGFIKIQDGCENFCSYCAIPFSRGKIRSRNPENVIDEIKTLVNNGTKEVIISGINTGTYGQDLGNISLANLIEMIMEQTSLYRLRLSSIELMEVTDELLNVIKRYESRVAMHFHIPLQGGSDATLRRMNRKYLTNDYRKTISKIRSMFPGVAITTDLLAGFVGETEDEFKETMAFIQEIGFASMHIFPYSRRKNTVADQMKGHLNPRIINERAHILQSIAKKMSFEYASLFKNTVQTVITEQKKEGYYVSHSSNYLEILVPSSSEISENMILKVKIMSIENNLIIGEVVNNE